MVEFLYEKHNPWWTDRDRIKKDITLLEYDNQRFKYEHSYLKSFRIEDAVIVIRGPRRIGKTTLLKLVIRKLLDSTTTYPQAVLFYPCNRIADYNELYDLLAGFLGKEIKGRRYIFLDEITFVRQWQRTIKDLWDSGDLRNCTVILTGSDALDLDISSERLPGRRGRTITDIRCLPLTFSEFVKLAPKDKRIDALFGDYVLCGGFPQAINEYYKSGFIPNFLYETYLSWIEGDIHKTGKSDMFLSTTVAELFKHLGSTVSWYKLAKNSGIGSHSTVEDYIDTLEKLFVTFRIHHYSLEEKKVYGNKNKKLYFSDPIIYHALRGKMDNFTDQFFGYSHVMDDESIFPAFIENIVALHLCRCGAELLYGSYHGKEIDFVLKNKKAEIYYEVKYRNTIKISDFSYWQKKEPLTVITKNFKLKRDNLIFLPLTEFLQSM